MKRIPLPLIAASAFLILAIILAGTLFAQSVPMVTVAGPQAAQIMFTRAAELRREADRIEGMGLAFQSQDSVRIRKDWVKP